MSNRPVFRLGLRLLPLAATVALLAACGGAGAANATPIPAGIVRPQQATPMLSMAQPVFRLDRSTPEPVFVTTEETDRALTPPPERDNRSLLRSFLMNQPPSAMGIATAGVSLVAGPGSGGVVATVPAGGAVTVTGRSADGAWLAAFTEEAIAGWIPAGSVVLFGDDDLTTVEEAFSPGPVATLIAEALTPVASPISAVLTAQASAPQAAAIATRTPAGTEAADEAQAGQAALGVVQSTGNLNLRSRPSTDGTVVASLRPQAQVVVLGRTQAGDWFQVRTPAGDGWVDARYVAIPFDAALLPVSQP